MENKNISYRHTVKSYDFSIAFGNVVLKKFLAQYIYPYYLASFCSPFNSLQNPYKNIQLNALRYGQKWLPKSVVPYIMRPKFILIINLLALFRSNLETNWIFVISVKD